MGTATDEACHPFSNGEFDLNFPHTLSAFLLSRAYCNLDHTILTTAKQHVGFLNAVERVAMSEKGLEI